MSGHRHAAAAALHVASARLSWPHPDSVHCSVDAIRCTHLLEHWRQPARVRRPKQPPQLLTDPMPGGCRTPGTTTVRHGHPSHDCAAALQERVTGDYTTFSTKVTGPVSGCGKDTNSSPRGTHASDKLQQPIQPDACVLSAARLQTGKPFSAFMPAEPEFLRESCRSVHQLHFKEREQRQHLNEVCCKLREPLGSCQHLCRQLSAVQEKGWHAALAPSAWRILWCWPCC